MGKGVRGDQVKAFSRFLAGDYGFRKMSSEKHSEARSRPSGCLVRTTKRRKTRRKVCRLHAPSLDVNFLLKTRFQSIGFHNESDYEADGNRLVRRPTVCRFFSGYK